MNTPSTKTTSTAAERMRAYRKRRREGMHHVRVALHVTEIDALVRLRLLRHERRQDPEALQVAVTTLIYQVLDGAP
jgi:hypothetical protein